MSCNNEKCNKLLIELFNKYPDASKYFIEEGIIEPAHSSECDKTNQPPDSDGKTLPQVS